MRRQFAFELVQSLGQQTILVLGFVRLRRPGPELLIETPVSTGQQNGKGRFEPVPQFLVPVRSRRLAFQRIDLPGHLLQDVVNAIEILASAFEFQLRQPFFVLNLVTPAASSTKARLSTGRELRICSILPCSMMA